MMKLIRARFAPKYWEKVGKIEDLEGEARVLVNMADATPCTMLGLSVRDAYLAEAEGLVAKALGLREECGL